LFRDESGAIVRLEDEGPAVLAEQCGECVAGGLGGLVGGGESEQLEAAGEVSHGEDVGIEAVDRCGRVGVVDGPDGPRPMPV